MALLLCYVRYKVNTVLKQRLIGAVVLIALAVIFLPMLIYSPSPEDNLANVPITAPNAPTSVEFETRVLPLATPPASNMPSAVPDNAIPAPVETARTARPPSNTSAPALPPAVAAGNYAVSFGAYASASDAQVVIAHLQNFNLRGFQHKDSLNGREVWRVRIGPYVDRAQAELARLEASKVRGDVNAQVIVLNAQPSTELAAVAPPLATQPTSTLAPTNTPAAAPQTPTRSEAAPLRSQTPAVATTTPPPSAASAPPRLDQIGWAVQVGAFSQAPEAATLRDRIRASGFSAFIEPVNTANGTVHRVRVGPVASRADAEQLKAQMALRIGAEDSLVVRHP